MPALLLLLLLPLLLGPEAEPFGLAAPGVPKNMLYQFFFAPSLTPKSQNATSIRLYERYTSPPTPGLGLSAGGGA